FLARFNAQYRRQKQIASSALARLADYSWPGNVRELENAIRRFVLLDREHVVDEPVRTLRPVIPLPSCAEGLREISRRGAYDAECRALHDVLEAVGWNRAEAARILKVSYKTLLNKISRFGLAPSGRGRACRPSLVTARREHAAHPPEPSEQRPARHPIELVDRAV